MIQKPKNQKKAEDIIRKNLEKVKHKFLILSGKGGVGKSSVAANLALALAEKYPGKIGLIDADIHGPNIPKMLGRENDRPMVDPETELAIPVQGPHGIKIVSLAFFLETSSSPVIWRGPMKMKALEQFLTDFSWGELEYLIVDLPPGTGDESLSTMQLIPGIDGVVIVTTPQDVSLLDTSKALSMVKQMKLRPLGVVENMSYFICPKCEEKHYLFGKGGGKRLAENFSVPLLGQVPFNPEIRIKEDSGLTESFNEFKPIATALENTMGDTLPLM